MAFELLARNKFGGELDFESYGNLRILGEYSTSAPYGPFSSAQSTHTEAIDLRTLLPSGFTFNSSNHRFVISKLAPGTYSDSCGTFEFDITVTVNHPVLGAINYSLQEDGVLASSSYRTPFPDFSLASNGYTLTITSGSYSIQGTDCTAEANALCPAVNASLAANTSIDSYTVNSCSATATNPVLYGYERGSYLVILTES